MFLSPLECELTPTLERQVCCIHIAIAGKGCPSGLLTPADSQTRDRPGTGAWAGMGQTSGLPCHWWEGGHAWALWGLAWGSVRVH